MGEHLGRDVTCDDVGIGSESSTDRKRYGAAPSTKIQDALPRTDARPLDEPLADNSEEGHGLVVGSSQPVKAHCVGRLHALSFSHPVASHQGGVTVLAAGDAVTRFECQPERSTRGP